jgi:hypothetical protein
VLRVSQAAAPAAPAALTEQQREQLKQLTMKEPVMLFMKVRTCFLHVGAERYVAECGTALHGAAVYEANCSVCA